jgi:hypothetical protein
VIIDAWMQHPSAAFLAEPVFDSLRRWARGRLGGGSDGEIPAAATVAAMDAAGVRTGMLCAWWGPRGPGLPGAAGGAPDCLKDLPGLDLDDETAGLFLYGNAERVFGL